MSTDFAALIEAIARTEHELHALRRKLAVQRDCDRIPSGEIVVLRCTLRGSAVALIATEIAEVLRMAELTRLPESPAWLMGLLTMGSKRLPIVDLSGLEGGARREADPEQFIVLVDTPTGPVGLSMDEIQGLSSVDAGAIARPTPELPFGAHVLGVFDAEGESVLLLSAVALSIGDYASEPAP